MLVRENVPDESWQSKVGSNSETGGFIETDGPAVYARLLSVLLVRCRIQINTKLMRFFFVFDLVLELLYDTIQ